MSLLFKIHWYEITLFYKNKSIYKTKRQGTIPEIRKELAYLVKDKKHWIGFKRIR